MASLPHAVDQSSDLFIIPPLDLVETGSCFVLTCTSYLHYWTFNPDYKLTKYHLMDRMDKADLIIETCKPNRISCCSDSFETFNK